MGGSRGFGRAYWAGDTARALRRLAARWDGRRGWLALPLLALPALAPLWQQGLLRSHDVPNHLLRLVNFGYHLEAGQLYPRWVSDLALGYGYPLYNFYAPAMYYLLQAWRWLGAAPALAFQLSLAALMLAAALGMWRLAADVLRDLTPHFSHWLPLTAAVCYLYAPYLLANAYVRGALAELMVMALLPWVLWAWRRAAQPASPPQYRLAAALLLGVLMVSHTLSLVIIPPLVAAYLLCTRPWRTLPWRALAGAGLAAVGVAAFFWLPVIAERGALGPGSLNYAYTWLPTQFLDWTTLTDWSLVFRYRYASPFQWGLVQGVLALLGFGLAGRRPREWVFLAVAAVGLFLLTLRLTQPLWLAVKPAAALQFPWRLLGPASLVLALLAAGVLVPLQRPWLRAAGAVAVMGLVIYAHLPRFGPQLERMPNLSHATSAGLVATYERDTNDIGLSANGRQVSSDFIPRWVNLYAGVRGYPPPADHLPVDNVALRLAAASPYAWTLEFSSAQPVTLRLTEFYFPGWRAWVDGRATPVYPSTEMGLLTLDVPAGTHRVRVAWAGTSVQWAATAVSWLALAALAVWAWRSAPRARWLAALPAAGLVVGVLAAALGRAQPAPLVYPPNPAASHGLELLGMRTVLHDQVLNLHPYWYVRQPPADVLTAWQLVDATGQVRAVAQTRPYYDTLPAYSWRTGTVVDDAYHLALPPGLAAGRYTLRFCFTPADQPDTPCAAYLTAGSLSLPATPAAPPLPAEVQPAAITLAGALQLEGYTLTGEAGPLPTSPVGHAVTHAGERLSFTLYWRALRLLTEEYHGFVHLVDTAGEKRAGLDDTLGAYYFPTRLWDTFYWQRDTYLVAVPPDLPSGLYAAHMGVYGGPNLARLPAADASGQPADSSVPLPVLKVLGQPAAPPAQPLPTHLAGLGRLLGYSLALPPQGLRPGGTFTVTTHYQALGGDPRDLREFIHLYHPALGLAAQHDGSPQQGGNPTWTWLAEEVVVSTAVLEVSPAAVPGRYPLLLGFYDPGANARVRATDAQGQPWTDNAIVLTEVEVLP